MDILYAGTVQGFCIVSSDSDFTRLCTRIRESGLFVMGMGRKETPESFIKACALFVYVENLIQPDDIPQSLQDNLLISETQPKQKLKPTAALTSTQNASQSESQPPTSKKVDAQISKKNLTKLIRLLHRAIDISVHEDGWSHLSALGEALYRLDPTFDSRTYGHKSLSLLIKSLPESFVMKGTKKGGPSSIYVRIKDDVPS